VRKEEANFVPVWNRQVGFIEGYMDVFLKDNKLGLVCQNEHYGDNTRYYSLV
jgi:hypothetical protein